MLLSCSSRGPNDGVNVCESAGSTLVVALLLRTSTFGTSNCTTKDVSELNSLCFLANPEDVGRQIIRCNSAYFRQIRRNETPIGHNSLTVGNADVDTDDPMHTP